MDDLALAQRETLPRLIAQAAAALAKATTAAEVLEARDRAALAYTAAKECARIAKAKQAHDEIIAACHKAQADALLIEARTKCRLAVEYDAAQGRNEIRGPGQPRKSIIPNENNTFGPGDIGLTPKQVYEARQIRDAEKADPGIVEKTLASGDPTRARLRRAVDEVLTPPKPAPAPQAQYPAPPRTVEREATALEGGGRRLAEAIGFAEGRIARLPRPFHITDYEKEGENQEADMNLAAMCRDLADALTDLADEMDPPGDDGL
jgi:hypothetical protein